MGVFACRSLVDRPTPNPSRKREGDFVATHPHVLPRGERRIFSPLHLAVVADHFVDDEAQELLAEFGIEFRFFRQRA
ncbi:hypothetical protein SPHI_26900 [Sphingomonas jeddahensis]|uniref:Uncharacterized protein n=1 Tax=Sphingomonas jeddahensis TaxID=1915074 RepID=A0A1V2ER45_9SPHN|nr:hypothetical protein SPHI_26900 [Sphingomonas jeddahensis]